MIKNKLNISKTNTTNGSNNTILDINKSDNKLNIDFNEGLDSFLKNLIWNGYIGDKKQIINNFAEKLSETLVNNNITIIDHDIYHNIRDNFIKILDANTIIDSNSVPLMLDFFKGINDICEKNDKVSNLGVNDILVSSIIDIFIREKNKLKLTNNNNVDDLLKKIYTVDNADEKNKYLRMVISSEYFNLYSSNNFSTVIDNIIEGFKYSIELINNGDLTMPELSNIVKYQPGFWSGITKNVQSYMSGINIEQVNPLAIYGLTAFVLNMDSGDSVSKGKIIQTFSTKSSGNIKISNKLISFDIFKKYKELMDIKNGGLGGLKNLKGKSVCITGTLNYPRAKVENQIKACGGVNVSMVTRSTDILVVSDMNTTSSKKVKADELIKRGFKIKIITERQLIDLINAK